MTATTTASPSIGRRGYGRSRLADRCSSATRLRNSRAVHRTAPSWCSCARSPCAASASPNRSMSSSITRGRSVRLNRASCATRPTGPFHRPSPAQPQRRSPGERRSLRCSAVSEHEPTPACRKSCCSVASLARARRALRRTPPRPPTPRAGPCCTASVTTSWRFRTKLFATHSTSTSARHREPCWPST